MSQLRRAPAASGDARHGLRIFLIWLLLAIIADLLIWFAWYPHLPPGRDVATRRRSQQFDIAVMAVLAAPVLLFVWVYFAYALDRLAAPGPVTTRMGRPFTATPGSRRPGSPPPR